MSVNNMERQPLGNQFGAKEIYLLFGNGITASVLTGVGFSLWEADFETQADYTTEDELETFYDLIKEHRTVILIAAAVLFVGFIFWMAILYYMKLLFENVLCPLLGSLGNFLKWMYLFTGLIVVSVTSALIPILLVITAYYDWKFTDSDGDTVTTGYYCQMLVARITSGLNDVGTYVGGLVTMNLYFNLAAIAYSQRNSKGLLNTLFRWCGCCPSLPSAFYVALSTFVVLLCAFCTFADLFAWGDDGFFSLSGLSQYGAKINLLFAALYFVWVFCLARNFDQVKPLLDMRDSQQEYKPIGAPMV